MSEPARLSRASLDAISAGFRGPHPEDLWLQLFLDPLDQALRGAVTDWYAARGDHELGDFAAACRAIRASFPDEPSRRPARDRAVALCKDVLSRRLGGWLGYRPGVTPTSWDCGVCDENVLGVRMLSAQRQRQGQRRVTATVQFPDGLIDRLLARRTAMIRIGHRIARVQPLQMAGLAGAEPLIVEPLTGGVAFQWWRLRGIPSAVSTSRPPEWGRWLEGFFFDSLPGKTDGPHASYQSSACAMAALSHAILSRARPDWAGVLDWQSYRDWFCLKAEEARTCR